MPRAVSSDVGRAAVFLQVAALGLHVVTYAAMVTPLAFGLGFGGGGGGFLLVLAPLVIALLLAHLFLAIDFNRRRGWESRRVRWSGWFLLLVEPWFMLYATALVNAGWLLGPMSWVALVAIAMIAIDIHAFRHARRASA